MDTGTEELFGLSADSWVAIGTLALAAMTGVLAWFTQRLGADGAKQRTLLAEQVAEGGEANRIANEALAAANRPLLVEAAFEGTPSAGPAIHVFDNAEGVGLRVAILNVGPGLASVRRARLMRGNGEWSPLSITRVSLPADRVVRVHGQDDSLEIRKSYTEGGPLTLEADYRDASGVHEWTLVLKLAGEPQGGWHAVSATQELRMVAVGHPS